MRVGVVGAGFAGLAAAVGLADAGVDVIVLEARDRVGGRVYSQPLTLDGRTVGIVERGAEFVLDGYESLRRHLGRTGLHLADTTMSYYVRDVHGIDPASLREAGLHLAAAASKAAPGTAVVDVLASLGLADDVAEALLARVEISCATSADRLHAGVVEHVAASVPIPSHRVAEGNQQLANVLARELGDRLWLSSPVRRITWDDTSVRITTDDRAVVTDLAVITVPAPVLRDLPVEPALPWSMGEALRRLEFGHAAKLHVPLSVSPPPTAVMSVEDRFWTWTATVGGSEVPPIVHSFAGSEAALARLDVSEGLQTWVERVERLRGDLALRTDAALLTTWSDDPWSRGAYTAQAPVEADVQALQRPVGPLHFAGEHTAAEWSGLMEGALRSGDRAAEEVLPRVRLGA